MSALLIFGLILAVLLVIFTLQNTAETTVNLFFWKITEAPLALVVLCCIVIGYFAALFYFWPKLWRLKRENMKLAKSNQKLEDKLNTMNITCLQDEDDNPLGIEMGKADDKFSLFSD